MAISNLSAERIERLQAQMIRANVDLVAIAPTANMRYLLGFAPLADERPCALLVGRAGTRLIIPELNADQVEAHTGMPAIRWADAAGPQQVFKTALGEFNLNSTAVLAADDSMRVDAFLLLQDIIRPAESVAAGILMDSLRLRKSDPELEILARAAAMADEAMLAGAEACRPGVTELAVANEIANSFRAHGAEAVNFTIVAAGPNGAFPHHETGNRPLEMGDTIIIDIGATVEGYKSDITRVVQLGRPSDEVQKVYDLVREANRRGRAAAVAGARARDVDHATRSVIEQAGYGRYFHHRTGHGLGLEIHEPPWITSESDTVLEPGMVFSVEPGIYLPGKFGIRIEDIVAVTDGECRRLTGLDHNLIVIG
jgi:Xaa-Pro aminopeptidase